MPNGSPSANYGRTPHVAAWLPFNFNDTIRVKLTPVGLQVLRDNFAVFLQGVPAHLHDKPAFQWCEPEVDADGYVYMQAWQFAAQFGPQGPAADRCFRFDEVQLLSEHLGRVYRRSSHGVW